MNPVGLPEIRTTAQASAWRAAGYLALLLAALHLAVGPRVRLGEWTAGADRNSNLAEAQAWRSGRLDLAARTLDTAYVDGRVYNVFPPLFSFFGYAAASLLDLQQMPVDPLYRPWHVAFVALPVPLAGFWAFLRLTQDPAKAALLAFAWIAGTPLLPCAQIAGGGGVSSTNHVLSQTGLMLMLAASRPRFNVAAGVAGVLIAGLTRPQTLLLALPLLYDAWKEGEARRVLRMTAIVAAAALAAAAILVLNKLKFGSFFEMGYGFIYEGRTDEIARRAAIGLFSLEHVPRNAWFMNVAFPSLRIDANGLRLLPDSHGASIWWTTPLLLYVVLDVRRWWADSSRRWWMLATFVLIALILTYHNTGYVQPGHYRFALDFIPVWLGLTAAWMWRGRRLPWTIAAITWSCIYFSLLT